MGTTVCNRDRAAAGCEKGTPGGVAPAPARGGSQGAQGACSLHCALRVQPCGASPLLCWRCPGESEAIAAPLVKGLAKRLVVVVPSARLTSLISMVVGGREEVEGEGDHRSQRSPHVSLSPVATRLSHVACEQSTGSARRCSALAPPSRPWYTSPWAGSIPGAHDNCARSLRPPAHNSRVHTTLLFCYYQLSFTASRPGRGANQVLQVLQKALYDAQRTNIGDTDFFDCTFTRAAAQAMGDRWRSTHSTQSVTSERPLVHCLSGVPLQHLS